MAVKKKFLLKNVSWIRPLVSRIQKSVAHNPLFWNFAGFWNAGWLVRNAFWDTWLPQVLTNHLWMHPWKKGRSKDTSGDFNCTWLDVNFELEQYLGDDWWRFTSPQEHKYRQERILRNGPDSGVAFSRCCFHIARWIRDRGFHIARFHNRKNRRQLCLIRKYSQTHAKSDKKITQDHADIMVCKSSPSTQ